MIRDGETAVLKPLQWVGSSKRDLLSLPRPVMDFFDSLSTWRKTAGNTIRPSLSAASVPPASWRLSEDWDRSTYRAVYTVRFEGVVFVLHIFQKESKRGAATPKADMDLIRERLKVAEQIAKELSR